VLRQAGMSMRRASPRVYSEEEKAAFFRLLAQPNNVSAVARELGFTRVTCYKWAHEAGIFTSETRQVNPRRERFLRLRQDGMSRAEAAAEVGADKRSAADWDRGIRVFHGGREHPDGRFVRYRQDQILAGMTSPRAAVVRGEQVDLARVERVIHPRYLSLRNTESSQGYLPHAAHRASARRRARPKEPKLLRNTQLRAYVKAKLRKKWSPQQISHRLVKDFPAAPEMRVSTETIYQAIYVHARGELKRELARQLRRGRTARKPRRDPNTRRPRFVDPMTPITMRPPDVEMRAVPGHWEGDLIIGAAGKSAIATLVERSSRFVMLGHLGLDRSADTVRDSLVSAVADLPDALRGTLTWDKGRKWLNTVRSRWPPTWLSTSASQASPGSAAATRTPMVCCASTSRAAPICEPTTLRPCKPSPTNSTDAPENPSPGTHPPNALMLY
jgi:IS30 family transposase